MKCNVIQALWQDVPYGRKLLRLVPEPNGCFFKNRVASRLQQLTEIANKYGKPWYIKIGAQSGQFTTLNEDWYQHY